MYVVCLRETVGTRNAKRECINFQRLIGAFKNMESNSGTYTWSNLLFALLFSMRIVMIIRTIVNIFFILKQFSG